MCCGIIGGIYLKSIIPLFFIICLYIFLLIAFKRSKYVRYANIFIKKNTICIFIIIYFLSGLYAFMIENRYNLFYMREPTVLEEAVVISEKKETQYNYVYEVKLIANQKLLLNVSKKSKNSKLEFGDYILINGEYIKPEEERNYGGFSYRLYLKSKGIYGTIYAKDIDILKKDSIKGISKFANEIKLFIKNKIKTCFNNETGSILIGILIGDTSDISQENKQIFKDGSLAHILAVSRNACKLYNFWTNFFI